MTIPTRTKLQTGHDIRRKKWAENFNKKKIQSENPWKNYSVPRLVVVAQFPIPFVEKGVDHIDDELVSSFRTLKESSLPRFQAKTESLKLCSLTTSTPFDPLSKS